MDDNRLPPLLIALLQSVLYRDSDLARWQTLLDLQARVRDYYVIIGLELVLDEAEGYAYLRQRPVVEGAAELPRLLPRRPLSYPVSLILVLLRKKMAEFDVTSSDSRLVMSREEMIESIRLFLPDTVNEVKLLNRIDTHINKIIEYPRQQNQLTSSSLDSKYKLVQWAEGIQSLPQSKQRHEQLHHQHSKQELLNDPPLLVELVSIQSSHLR